MLNVDDTAKKLNFGTVFLMLIPLGAAVVHLMAFEVGRFRVSGWLWVIYLLAAAVLIQAELAFSRRRQTGFPVLAFLPWLSVVWLSLLWSSDVGFRNIQDALQISMPTLIGVTAAIYARDRGQFDAFLRAVHWSTGLMLCTVLGSLVIGHELAGARTLSITAVFFGCLAIARTSEPKHRLAGYALWAVCLLLTAGTGSRTTTAVLLVLPVINPLNRNLLVRGGLLAAVVLSGIALFYTPQFQTRFFYDGHGTIGDVLRGDFLSFGRFEAWPAIFGKACQRPLWGAGVGEVVEFVPQVWPAEDKPHNDYLRIFFETGLLGTIIFWPTLILQYRRMRRLATQSTGRLRENCGAVCMGIVAFAMLAATDNVLIYNLYYNNLLFALLGLGYGVAAREADSTASTTSTTEPRTANAALVNSGPSRVTVVPGVNTPQSFAIRP